MKGTPIHWQLPHGTYLKFDTKDNDVGTYWLIKTNKNDHYLLPLQAHTHQTMSSPSQNTLKIGIIGFGPFAQFLAKTMIKQSHCITATSRSDYSNLCTQMGISFFRYFIHVCLHTYMHIYTHTQKICWWICQCMNRNMNEFLESDNDVILFCTSILSLSQVISTIPFNFLKKPALFADVLSVKEHPRDLMLQVC